MTNKQYVPTDCDHKEIENITFELTKPKTKQYYIKEPFGLPFELTTKDRFKQLKR